MQKLIFGDCHIDEESIPEIQEIFKEIVDNYKAITCIILGDFYNKRHPTPAEIDFGTKWVSIFKEAYDEVYMLTGNHEEIDTKCSSIKYLQHLSVNIVEDEFLLNNILLGHFFVDKSNKCFNNFKYELKLLEQQYNSYILLGHQHGFQKLSDRSYHLGSIRYVTYNEIEDKNKYIATIANNQISFPILKTTIPMIEVFDSKDLEQLNNRTKVRFTIKSFDVFKQEVNNFAKWQDRFIKFKVKLDFEQADITSKNYNKNSDDLKIVLKEWLDKINDIDVKKELESIFDEVQK